MRTLQQGQFSDYGASFRGVLRTQSEWAAFWSKHTRTQSLPSAAPSVDFPREMVIAMVADERTSGGYTLTILSVREGTSVVVMYAESAPLAGGVSAAVITRPFHIVAVPMSDAPVVFVEGAR